MANNDSGDRKKSDGLLPKSVLVIACACMVTPATAVIIMMLTDIFCKGERVDSNFAINAIMAAATILTVLMVLIGLVLFSKLRDVKDEYREICEVGKEARGIRDKLRDDADKLEEKYKKREEEAKEAQRKREGEAKEAQRKLLAIIEHFNKGVVLFGQPKYNEAIAEFSECLKIDPSLAVAYGARGLARVNKGDIGSAIADFDKAIELDPKDVVTYYNLACVYAPKGDKAKAIEYLSRAVDNGYRNLEELKKDPRLDSIRDEQGYKEVEARLRRLVQE